MGKTIHITESQMESLVRFRIRESEEEVTYYEFKFPCLDFIDSLLKDPNPSRAKLGYVFTSHGVSKEKLEKCLRKHSILSSKQRIVDDEGDKSAHYVRRYIRNANNLEEKLQEVFNDLFNHQIKEDCSCGATNCGGVGAGAGIAVNAFGPGPLCPTGKGKKKKKRKKGMSSPTGDLFNVVRRRFK